MNELQMVTILSIIKTIKITTFTHTYIISNGLQRPKQHDDR